MRMEVTLSYFRSTKCLVMFVFFEPQPGIVDKDSTAQIALV